MGVKGEWEGGGGGLTAVVDVWEWRGGALCHGVNVGMGCSKRRVLRERRFLVCSNGGASTFLSFLINFNNKATVFEATSQMKSFREIDFDPEFEVEVAMDTESGSAS